MLLKESGEMYLETVYILLQERGAVRSVDVAKRMGFSGASVCRAMRILQDGGYLRQDKNKRLLLTEAGEARARKLYERHELLISFLTAIGVSEAAASADACKLEHYMSEETFRAIRRRLRPLSRGRARRFCAARRSSLRPIPRRRRRSASTSRTAVSWWPRPPAR